MAGLRVVDRVHDVGLGELVPQHAVLVVVVRRQDQHARVVEVRVHRLRGTAGDLSVDDLLGPETVEKGG